MVKTCQRHCATEPHIIIVSQSHWVPHVLPANTIDDDDDDDDGDVR